MRSLRRLVVVGATVMALSVLVPSASAASQGAFHLEKTCIDTTTGSLCTVTSSSFKWIPVGTEITYDGSGGYSHLVATINVKNGSATGVCDISALPGSCNFDMGTGRLTQFHLNSAVTYDGSKYWFWDGTYWFGGGD
jgi:hypothetical protein